MKTLSLSKAKNKLSVLVGEVQTRNSKVVITKKGAPVAMLISLHEFESLKETLAVRSNDALMQEICAGVKALKTKRARLYTLQDLFS